MIEAVIPIHPMVTSPYTLLSNILLTTSHFTVLVLKGTYTLTYIFSLPSPGRTLKHGLWDSLHEKFSLRALRIVAFL